MMFGGCNISLELHLLQSLNMMSNVMALLLKILNLKFCRLISRVSIWDQEANQAPTENKHS